MTYQMKKIIVYQLTLLWCIIALGSFGYFVYQEYNDDDVVVYIVNEKRAGIVTWTETEHKNKQIHHDAGAIWIKATMESAPYSSCTWAERNPFTADAYKIGGRYDFRNHHVSSCNHDPSPNGTYAVAVLFLSLFCGLIWIFIFEDFFD